MVSLHQIIYEIQSNPLFQHVKKSDIVNHMRTVINLIGAPGLYIDKIIQLNIYDFHAQLPADFVNRTAVRRVLTEDTESSTVYVPLAHNTDQFYKSYSELPDEEKANVDLLYTHKIVGNVIWVDFEEGVVEVAYKAFDTDEEGFPKIHTPSQIADEAVKEAISWFIKQKFLETLWFNQKIPRDVYMHALQQYHWYIGQASNAINTPDPVEAEALANSIVRLISQTDNVESGHKYDSQKERLNTDFWRR